MTRWTTVLSLVAVLALAACSPEEPEFLAQDQVRAEDREPETGGDNADDGGNAETAADVLSFTAIDIDFEVEPPSEVPAGDYTVELINEGTAVHNVVFDDISDEPVAEADGGGTDSGSVTLEAGNTYRYHCDVPGHEALMNGEITAS